MARILYISVGMPSTLHGSMELGRRLDAAGHQVSFACHNDISQWTAPYGFSFYELSGDRRFKQRAAADRKPRVSILTIPAVLAWAKRRRRIRQQSVESPEIEELVERLAPDLLLIDLECHFAIIATAGLGIPRALTMFWFSTFRSPNVPPLHTQLLPGESPRERLRVRVAWWRLNLESRFIELRYRLSRRGIKASLAPINYRTVRYRDLKAVAHSRGFDLHRETDRTQWVRPFMYQRLPILSFNIFEMDFSHEPHANLHYVGPMVNQHRPEPHGDDTGNAAWKSLKLDLQRQDGDRSPVIYVALGSYLKPDERFLDRLLEVGRRRKEWTFIIGLGGKGSAEDLDSLPDNVLVMEWAPQLDVLQFADCALIHAGISTINECVRYGVPMIVHSTHTVDQDGCAARIAYHHLGILGDKSGDNSAQLERNIESVLCCRELQENIASMQAHMIACENSGVAVSTLTGILDKALTGS